MLLARENVCVSKELTGLKFLVQQFLGFIFLQCKKEALNIFGLKRTQNSYLKSWGSYFLQCKKSTVNIFGTERTYQYSLKSSRLTGFQIFRTKMSKQEYLGSNGLTGL